MINNYPKAYVEVLEILKYIPAEEKKKIPYDIIETLKNKADLNYVFKIDFNIPFEKQNLLNETKSILANFYRDYWATDVQRQQILSKERKERSNRESFNYDNLFKNRKKEKIDNNSITIYKKNRKWYAFFTEFLNKILK